MTFQSGKSGNPGGKPSRARQELSDLLDETFTTAKRKKVLRRLVADAEAGNHEARVLLLAYTFGKPIERKEVSGPDGVPLKTYIGLDIDAWDDTEETAE